MVTMTVTANKTGYVPSTPREFGWPGNSTVNITLQSDHYTLHGRVYNLAGAGITNATVDVEGTYVTTTDGYGNYTINMPTTGTPGVWNATAGKAGYTSVTYGTTYPTDYNQSGGFEVNFILTPDTTPTITPTPTPQPTPVNVTPGPTAAPTATPTPYPTAGPGYLFPTIGANATIYPVDSSFINKIINATFHGGHWEAFSLNEMAAAWFLPYEQFGGGKVIVWTVIALVFTAFIWLVYRSVDMVLGWLLIVGSVFYLILPADLQLMGLGIAGVAIAAALYRFWSQR
jgi:hypothetical protein